MLFSRLNIHTSMHWSPMHFSSVKQFMSFTVQAYTEKNILMSLSMEKFPIADCLADIKKALSPVVVKYSQFIDPHVLSQLKAGLISETEALESAIGLHLRQEENNASNSKIVDNKIVESWSDNNIIPTSPEKAAEEVAFIDSIDS